MFLPGDIVTLKSQGKRVTGTGIVVESAGIYSLISKKFPTIVQKKPKIGYNINVRR